MAYVSNLINIVNDEINLKEENMKDLLEIIDWSRISTEYIMEFLMKYYEVVETADMENFFFDVIESKLSLPSQSAMRSKFSEVKLKPLFR